MDVKDKRKEYEKQYRLANKDKKKEYNKQYRLDNLDKLQEYRKQWCLDNKKYMKQWRLANQDKIKRDYKQWCLDNKDKIKQHYLDNQDKYIKYSKQYRLDNPDKIKQHYVVNKDNILEYAKEHYQDNKEKIKARTNQYRLANLSKIKNIMKQWRLDNKDKIKQYNIIHREKMSLLYPLWMLNKNISSGIRSSLTNNNNCKGGRSWESLVGYTLMDLRKHIESFFVEEMSWVNRGRNYFLKTRKRYWEIDHELPIDYWIKQDLSEEEFLKNCWALDNLQPLWQKDNNEKSNSLDWVKPDSYFIKVQYDE